MSSENRFLALLGVVAGVLLVVAVPNFTREVKILLWLAWGAGAIGFLVHEVLERFRRTRMTLLTVIGIGAMLGAIAGLVTYYVFPPEPPGTLTAATPPEPSTPKPEKPPYVPERIKSIGEITVTKSDKDTGSDPSVFRLKKGVSAVICMSPLIPDPDLKTAYPDDLQFYFFPFMAGAFESTVQYATATITNRSAQKMYLQIWGHVDYWKDDGEPYRIGPRTEWNPDGHKVGTGQEFIELEAYETKKGRIMMSLGEPEKYGLSRWFVDVNEDVYIEVFDTVTGKRNAFRAMQGYPLGQVPAPLTSVKQMLALNFPQPGESDKKSDSPPDSLQLVLRTADETYGDGEKGLQAIILNKSGGIMEISINLLICDPPGGSVWHSCEGLAKVRLGDNEYSGFQEVVTVMPGATTQTTIKFDISALSAGKPEDWSPTAPLPKEMLLEIHDRVSNKTVWCAVNSGYPPGTDMRPFTIRRKSSPESNNLSVGDSNTP